MNPLSIIGMSSKINEALPEGLSEFFESEFIDLADIGSSKPGLCTLVDFDFSDIVHIPVLKNWIQRKPTGAKIVFITDQGSHLQATRAYAIGATDIVHRPIESRDLVAKLLGNVASLSNAPSNEAVRKSPGVSAAVDTLQNIFSSACCGESINAAAVHSAADAVVGQLEAQGLTSWIDAVRTHHSQTYQHCLLVTGLAVAFGQHIGVSRIDRQRLSFAGMLHDVGKARIPLAILEKPGPLDSAELAIMRQHPQFGFDALRATPGLPPEMLDMVIHHHEYIDGSGYPHGLGSNEISDLVRMMTISDVFGALIERRSYKPPMSGETAYQVLLDMDPKLDKDMVREFRPVARLERHQ